MQFDDFVSRLEGVRKFSDGSIVAKCPAHDDAHASLSARRGDHVPIVAFCHAGCDFRRIIRAADFAAHRRVPR
jgi:putative DNA primase/helicase